LAIRKIVGIRMKITATIDRIEGEYAILEVDNVMVNWPLHALPVESSEGDVIILDIKRTNDQISETEARLDRLKERASSAKNIKL
jgi:hypothetical protein